MLLEGSHGEYIRECKEQVEVKVSKQGYPVAEEGLRPPPTAAKVLRPYPHQLRHP